MKCLISDTLRTRHVKYEMTPDKEIDSDVGIWLAYAQFKLKKN